MICKKRFETCYREKWSSTMFQQNGQKIMAFGYWCCRWFNSLSYVNQVQTFGVRRCWKFTPHFGTESGWSKELFFWFKRTGNRIANLNLTWKSIFEWNVRSCQPCCTSIQFDFTRCFHCTLQAWTSKDVIVRAAVRNRCWILVEGGPNGVGSQDWARLKDRCFRCWLIPVKTSMAETS